MPGMVQVCQLPPAPVGVAVPLAVEDPEALLTHVTDWIWVSSLAWPDSVIEAKEVSPVPEVGSSIETMGAAVSLTTDTVAVSVLSSPIAVAAITF